MSEKLAQLEKKGGSGNGEMVETVLWTNSSPTSSFSGQDAVLSQSIYDFDYLIAETRFSTSKNTRMKTIYEVNVIPEYSAAPSTDGSIYPTMGAYYSGSYRPFYIKSGTDGCTIRIASGSAGSNRQNIPLTISGGKIG